MQTKANWTPIFPGYGYMWWINRFGGYAALGYGGQYIFVVPKLDLVVVFTSGLYDDKDLFYPGELMENFIIRSIKSDSPLKNDPDALEALRKETDMVQNAPKSEPVSSLPDIAKEISGKPFIIENSTTLTLWFNDGKEFTIDKNSKYTYKAGLDNVYRIVEMGSNMYGTLPENHRAYKGRWLDEKTLEVTAQDLEDGFVNVYSMRFNNNQIEVNYKLNLGNTEQNFKGEFKK
jgi:hypothetical protein